MKYILTIIVLLFSITCVAGTKAWLKDKHEWVVVDHCYKNDEGGYSATINGQAFSVDRCAIKNTPKQTGTQQISNNVSNLTIQDKSSSTTKPKPAKKPQLIKVNPKKKKSEQID